MEDLEVRRRSCVASRGNNPAASVQPPGSPDRTAYSNTGVKKDNQSAL